MTDETIHTEQWPHDATKVDKGSVTFAPVQATIARVINGPGYVFEGDTTKSGRHSDDGEEYIGVVWWLQGDWDEALKGGQGGRRPPDDLGFQKGHKVIVHLNARRTEKQTYFNCTAIKAAPGSEQPPTPARVAQGGRDETRASIERQTAFKGVVEILCAKIGIGTPVEDYENEWGHFAKMFTVLWTGAEPLDPAAQEPEAAEEE